MQPDLTSAQTLLDAATQALNTGDRPNARRYAEQAAALAPQIEEPWLMLAFLASPKAAAYYLEQALKINPSSPRALAALAWLKEQSVQTTQPTVIKSSAPAASAAKPRRSRMSIWLVLLVALVGLATLGSAAHLAEFQDAAMVWAVQTATHSRNSQISTGTAAPSETKTTNPSSTPTTAPSATATTSPTATNTASPMPTATSTATPKPTATQPPAPTKVKNTAVVNTNYTIQPGDTLNLIAQRYNVSLPNLIAANNIPNPSNIRAGQVIIIPNAGLPPAAKPTTVANSTGPNGSGKGKEILIDISEQHLYAYQDHELVFSLVASTGIGNSTRIGTFKVLDKIPKAYSNAFNIWMPYWMGIYYSGSLENGIHGLPLLWNGVELWGNLLGKPATYGCIESRTGDIKKLYDWAEIGTPVIIRQ